MSEPARHLHIVDSDGELHDLESCPLCAERDRELARMRTIISTLRSDKAAEARDHQLWSIALALWREWKIATGRVRCRWSADRFWLCHPYLDADGFVICRWAVWGVAYEPNTRTLPSGLTETYNDWELCFRSRGTFERYARRGYANPVARRQFSLREMGCGEDDATINPNLYFAAA